MKIEASQKVGAPKDNWLILFTTEKQYKDHIFYVYWLINLFQSWCQQRVSNKLGQKRALSPRCRVRIGESSGCTRYHSAIWVVFSITIVLGGRAHNAATGMVKTAGRRQQKGRKLLTEVVASSKAYTHSPHLARRRDNRWQDYDSVWEGHPYHGWGKVQRFVNTWYCYLDSIALLKTA